MIYVCNKNTPREEDKMKKGHIYKINGQERFFQIVGFFGGDFVLAPMNQEEEQVLIYSREEMSDFIRSGYFSRTNPTNKK